MTDDGTPTALIADDEPLLRERLAQQLACAWPELRIVAEARNGREALMRFDEASPDVVFLDVQMPGLNGIDAARGIRRQAEIVFVTAFDEYAVQAFEQGAVDYLVKPVDPARLADTVRRLRGRLAARRQGAAEPAPIEPLLQRLSETVQRLAGPGSWLQWIKASVGPAVRLIPVDEVAYLRSDEKYTLVAWSGGEALIRKPIRELAEELDPASFVQVHRSVIVNLHHVAEVVRGSNETAEVRLRGRDERLPVSRSFGHLFKQM